MDYYSIKPQTDSSPCKQEKQAQLNNHSVSTYKSYDNKTSVYFTCNHTKTVKSQDLENCHSCGVMIPKNKNVQAFKTQKMNYGAFFSSKRYYKNMFKQNKIEKFILKLNNYVQHRDHLIDWVFDVAEKLKLSLRTIHLGVFFLDYIVTKDSKYQNQLQFYAAICLMIASKSIELDERIPFLSRLRKYSIPSYPIDEFRKAENHILDLLQFNVQICTNLDLLDFYTSQGIIFSNDEINNEYILSEQNENIDLINTNKENYDDQKTQKKVLSEKKIFELTSKLERDIRRLSNIVLKDEALYEYDQKILGAACIAFIRKVYRFKNCWNKELENLSGIKEQQLLLCIDKFLVKFEKHFSFQDERIIFERAQRSETFNMGTDKQIYKTEFITSRDKNVDLANKLQRNLIDTENNVPINDGKIILSKNYVQTINPKTYIKDIDQDYNKLHSNNLFDRENYPSGQIKQNYQILGNKTSNMNIQNKVLISEYWSQLN